MGSSRSVFLEKPRSTSTPTPKSDSSSSYEHCVETEADLSDREMVCDAVRDFAISGSNIPVEEDRFTKFFIDQSEKIRISPPVIYPPFAMEDLDTTLVENLRRLKYNRLLPVQSYAISVILSGGKLVVRAPTGSGKTGAFLIPAIELVIRYHKSCTRRTDKPLVLILGNTQNLMAQTFDFACKMAGYSPDTKVSRTQVRILDLYMGGTSSHRFQQPFEHEIVVATTGGIKKAISLSKIDLSALQLLILDEADKMVDSRRGFGYDVAEIFSMIPDETRANINVAEFSATFAEGSDEVYLTELDRELFHDAVPVFIDVSPPLGYVTQRVIQKSEVTSRLMGGPASSFDKNMSCLIGLIESDLRLHSMQNRAAPYKNSIVIFVERKITSNYIALFLQQMGYHFEPLNSDYLVEDNKRTLARLMNREIQGVVATNKLSRGQDIPDVDHVIIFEMASNFDDYKHRIGRTGRMGNGGRATVMLSLSNDCMHVVPLVDFMVHHNQIIPQWLYDAYLTIKEGEQRQQLSAHSDSFVSAEQEISEEDDDCIGEDVIMARI